MKQLLLLKNEIGNTNFSGYRRVEDYYRYLGYREHFDDDPLIAKAHAVAKLFACHEKFVYDNDLVAGSLRGCYSDVISDAELKRANSVVGSFGRNSFFTNFDHYAADFESALHFGVGGIFNKINVSLDKHRDENKRCFLNAAKITMNAFSEMIKGYAGAAEQKGLLEVSRICNKVAWEKPDSFHEALQLIWFIHTSFLYEGRFSMALGRLDQYLYPFYIKDSISGDRATELIACTLYKIYERNRFLEGFMNLGRDDVVNIAVGGVKRDGSDAVNELSYIILDAVKACHIPGPNLSARISVKNPDRFVDKCLEVIGTGIGYPALMNDEVNVAALSRYGYDIEDCRDYAMVGCIENFIPGKQPPWSDGRFNSPKYIELALNNGICKLTGMQIGPKTGEAADIKTMPEFLDAVQKQMSHGAAEYVRMFNNEAMRYDRQLYSQPYLSCYHNDCIDLGLDIRDGGSVYPSIHGAACMGIATVTDSLAAIEKVVFEDKVLSLAQLNEALNSDFEGFEDVRRILLKAPKYGNNDDFADKYACWFVDTHYELFSKYRTFDDGGFYIAIASNIDNIPAGYEVAATPDGRKSKEPLSDAASPGHGFDVNGITASLLSCSKPDFTKVACGTVLNVKFSGSTFKSKNIEKLRGLVRVYFERGGQEMQINCVSKSMLEDASTNPQKYKDLVVRVSGFSAFYVYLDESVQNDILERTEHG